mgnify:CR=1 FL=1|jgi:hypothetical protein
MSNYGRTIGEMRQVLKPGEEWKGWHATVPTEGLLVAREPSMHHSFAV